MAEEKVIMYDSPEAATFKTGIFGWVSSTGQFFGNGDGAERSARYAGSTHHVCECGQVAERMYTHCADCRSKREGDRYLKLTEVEWDGSTPLCLFEDDKYFYDEDDICQYCEDNEIESTQLRLVLCEPNSYTEVDVDAIAPEDVSPEDYDGDLPKEIQEALDNLNKVIREYKKPFTWSAGKKRVTVLIDKEE